ncbi:MAG: hypothetical protein QXP17_00230 [Candidatus Jordarchaeales archaeon]
MGEVICPSCGRSVIKARFCAFCGSELIKENLDEGVPNDVLEQLAIRKRIEEVTGEIAFLKSEIDRLAKVIAESKAVEDYALKVKNLKEKIKKVSSERASLEEKVKPLSLERVAEERASLEGKLKRLEEVFKRKEISNETYEKLKREYSEKLEHLKGEHYKEVIRFEKWIELLKRKVRQIKEESEILYARYAIGELTKEEYDREKEKLDKELELNNSYIEMLELILRKCS